ncbi:MAG: hypothetical protein A2X56_05225 [Nitrospirae bacterium GWC2_57_13]|jgi:glycerol kinase|nr:MAG: hypothetical protein A2X56_05225 [Nitrospirae bacterium GWC2_57_13]OGW45859.1 MAG: hypothetical protein A2X57_02920 [Nitrospirae bacterium GWD2_57_8]
MTAGCFIGIDQGSSSTKVLALGVDGQVLYQTRKELPPPVREDLRVEQDPREILASVEEALSDTLQTLAGKPVLGIGLSCQRSSCLLWNEATGEPLSPVLSWRDTRGIEFLEQLAARKDLIFKATGLPLTPYYSATKFRWLRKNLPAASASGAVFGTLSSFLTQRLTGAGKALIDHTSAARTQLVNIRSLSWDPELLSLFELDGIRLPEIVPTVFKFGTVPAAGAPLLACIGDQQAAMVGLGVLEKGDGGINYGTGGFLMVNTGADLVPAPGLMASVHYSTEQTRTFLIEGSVNAVGDALEWLRGRFGLFKEYPEVDDLCWKAVDDVVAFVALNGTGAPHWEPDISSALHGLTAESRPADIVRATVEGIAFFMKDIGEAIRSAGIEPRSFVAAGGLSAVTYLVQLQADLLKSKIRTSAVQDASAFGAALLAGLQQGAWTMADIRKMTALGEDVVGEDNPGATRRYRRWKELHGMTAGLDRVK